MRPRRRRHTLALLLAAAAALRPAHADGAELQSRTVDAWQAYVAAARRAFVDRPRPISRVPRTPDRVTAAAARDDGIIAVPGGLIHHWVGRAFLPGISLPSALAVSQAYDAYEDIYESVIASRVLNRQGQVFDVLQRLEEGAAGVTAVLEIRSRVSYSQVAPSAVIALANTDHVREVVDAGRPAERLRPEGRDSGYLWRASTFTYLEETDGGLFVELETVGLSREFPPLLAWLVEPVARRLGRQSVEGSLREFIRAIRSAHGEGTAGPLSP